MRSHLWPFALKCRVIVAYCVFLVSASYGLAAECAFKRVPIELLDPSSRAVYSGKAKTVELRFSNFRANDPVDVFPESPLRLTHLGLNSTCEIDGGIWIRAHVYLSRDEKTLLTREYSGNNEQLMFYATSNCRKLAEVDVTDARFLLQGNRLVIRHSDARRLKKADAVYRFTERCIPAQPYVTGKR